MIDPANREGRNKQREKETNFFFVCQAGMEGAPCVFQLKERRRKSERGNQTAFVFSPLGQFRRRKRQDEKQGDEVDGGHGRPL